MIGQFDFIVDGSITGFLKPDPRAFQLALEAFGRPDPADVVFVDDQRINLRGAEAVGLVDGASSIRPTRASSFDRIEAALR